MLGTKILSMLVVVKQKSIYHTNVSSCCDGTSESSGRMSVWVVGERGVLALPYWSLEFELLSDMEFRLWWNSSISFLTSWSPACMSWGFSVSPLRWAAVRRGCDGLKCNVHEVKWKKQINLHQVINCVTSLICMQLHIQPPPLAHPQINQQCDSICPLA